VFSTEFRDNSLPKNQPSRSDSGDNAAFRNMQEEHFVDAAAAAAFLSLSRKHVLKLARLGLIPAYPISFGSRSVWRFRITELENWMVSRQNGVGDSQKGRA
jgi:predicted DNA-binding transcriptional regulator AlpA